MCTALYMVSNSPAYRSDYWLLQVIQTIGKFWKVSWNPTCQEQVSIWDHDHWMGKCKSKLGGHVQSARLSSLSRAPGHRVRDLLSHLISVPVCTSSLPEWSLIVGVRQWGPLLSLPLTHKQAHFWSLGSWNLVRGGVWGGGNLCPTSWNLIFRLCLQSPFHWFKKTSSCLYIFSCCREINVMWAAWWTGPSRDLERVAPARRGWGISWKGCNQGRENSSVS